MKNIVLDLDGTLIDSSEGIYSALKEAGMINKLPIPPIEKFKDHIGPPIDKIFDDIFNINDELVKRRFCASFREVYDKQYWKQVEWYPNVIHTLRYLKSKGYKLYIVTNKPTIPSTNIVKDVCLQGVFENIIGIDYRLISKTGKRFDSKLEALDCLIKSYSLKIEESLYIGDTISDHLAASNAHMKFIGVTYGYGSWVDWHMKNECYINKFTDLVNCLK